MSSFRRYGGLDHAAKNNIIHSYISNSETKTSVFVSSTQGHIGGVTFQDRNVYADNIYATGHIEGAASGNIGGVTFQNGGVFGQFIQGTTAGNIGGVTFQNGGVFGQFIQGTTAGNIGGVTFQNGGVFGKFIEGTTAGNIGGVTFQNGGVFGQFIEGTTAGNIGGITFQNGSVFGQFIQGTTAGNIGGVTFQNGGVFGQFIQGTTAGNIGGVTFQNGGVFGKFIEGTTAGNIGGVTFQNKNITTSGTLTFSSNNQVITTNTPDNLYIQTGATTGGQILLQPRGMTAWTVNTNGNLVAGGNGLYINLNDGNIINNNTVASKYYQMNDINSGSTYRGQIYSKNTGVWYFDNTTNNGEFSFTTNGPTGVQIPLVNMTSAAAKVTTTLNVGNNNTPDYITFISSLGSGQLNSLVNEGDSVICATGATANSRALTLTVNNSGGTASGVRITPSSVTIGSGGTGPLPTSSILFSGATAVVSGGIIFNGGFSVPSFTVGAEPTRIQHVIDFGNTPPFMLGTNIIANSIPIDGVTGTALTVNGIQEIVGKKTFKSMPELDTTVISNRKVHHLSDYTYDTTKYALVNQGYVDRDYDDTPPLFVFDNIHTTSSEIFISIKYPTQYYRGTCPQPIPTITGCVFSIGLVDSNNNTITLTTIDSTSTKLFDPNYVWPLSTDAEYKKNTSEMKPLTGIIISRIQDTRAPELKDFYTTKDNFYSRKCYTYKLTPETINGRKIIITGRYVNYVNSSSESNTNSYPNIIYVTSYAPTDDIALTTPSLSNTSATINITRPTLTNNNGGVNDNPLVTISSYTYRYSTSGSTNRYTLAYAQIEQGNTTSVVSSPQSLTLSNLYPESVYNFFIKSTNSIGAVSTEQSFVSLFTTTHLPPLIIASTTNISSATIAVPPTLIQAKHHTTNTATNIILDTTAGYTTVTYTNNTELSINYDDKSRGKLGSSVTKLMTLEAIVTAGANTTNSATTEFKSFANSSITSTINTNLTITNNNPPVDQYSQYANQYKGFYSKITTFNVNISTQILQLENNTLNITQKYYSITDSLIQTYTRSTPIDIFYDRLVGNPSITTANVSFSLNLANPSNYMTQISGIWVLRRTPIFSVNVPVSNLYNKYYVSTSDLLTYTFTEGCSQTLTESNLINYNSNVFSRTDLTPPISSSFKNIINLELKARNLNGLSNIFNTSINIICDPLSYALITSTIKYPNSIQTITPSGVPGYRVWTDPGSNIVPSGGITTYIPSKYGSSNNTVSYSHVDNIYKHDQDISTGPYIEELQISNGRYRSGTNANNTYLNYKTYKKDNANNNTLDYLNVLKTTTSYRFATFVWQYTGTISSPTITSFVFTFKNFSTVNKTLNTNSEKGSTFFNGDNRFFLHYRVEDPTNVAPVSTGFSTIWVDGNSKNGTMGTTTATSLGTTIDQIKSIDNTNYFSEQITPQDNNVVRVVRAPLNVSYKFEGNDLVATVDSIWYSTPDKSFKVYCRIGLPMNTNYEFEYVTLKLSS